MKSNEFRKVKVNITTYKKDSFEETSINMNEDKNRRNKNINNKFICSICLNSKPEDKKHEINKKNPKVCPIRKRSCDICTEKASIKAENNHLEIPNKQKIKNATKAINEPRKKTETKSVQTVQTDLNKSLNLLNEVLTVFQTKKTEQFKHKTVIFKDASVSTNDVKILSLNLSVSKVFHLSIDQNRENENGKFIVMSSKVDSQKSHINLLINKSSSIPQMKLEELKYSHKEKVKSRDTIEEVNRMFATVRKNYNNNDVNRPSIRNGPRILPVVETTADHNKKFLEENDSKEIKKHTFKCCQTSMSSGDSIKCCFTKDNEKCDKTQCCHIKDSERCENCVYMLCCHYKNCRKMKADVMICDRCKDVKETQWKATERSFEDSG